MTRYIQKLLGGRSSSRRFIAVQAGGMYALRVSYKAVNFIIAVMLARWLGQAAYGVYFLAWSWAFMLIPVAAMGLNQLGMREIARGYIEKNWGLVKGFLTWSFARAMSASLAVAALMAGAAAWAYANEPATRNAFLVASLLIPATALVRRLQSVHDGLKNMAQGRMPDMFIQPLVFIGCVALVYWRFPAWLTPAVVLALYVGTTAVFSWGITSWLLTRIMPPEIWTAKPERNAGAWGKSLWVFVFISLVLSADSRISTLLLGALAAKTDVAIYGVMTRVVDVLTFILFSLNPPVIRQGLQYYQEGNLGSLQRLLTRTARLATLLGLPVAVLLILFGKLYLQFFGPEYLPGYPAMVLLVIGEMINLATGLSGGFLSMTKYETTAAKVVAFSLALNFALGWALIPRYGLTGGAIAEISSIAFRYTLLSYLTWKKVGVNPTIFSFMPLRAVED